jgi:CHAD domain-containing protein
MIRPLPDCRVAFQEIARSCVEAIHADEAGAIFGDPMAIHAMRIELTRLRAARCFFSPAVNDTAWLRVDRQLQWLNSALGRARDRDVVMDYTERKRYRDWAADSHRRLMRSRDKAHHRLAKKLRSARYNRLTIELGRRVSQPPSQIDQRPRNDRVDVYSEKRLRDWRKDISRKGRHVGTLDRKRLHQLRIQSKNYRYMIDALLKLDIPISREDFSFGQTAKQIQQTLGDIRDLARLQKVVGRRLPHYRRRKGKLIKRIRTSFRRLAPWRPEPATAPSANG